MESDDFITRINLNTFTVKDSTEIQRWPHGQMELVGRHLYVSFIDESRYSGVAKMAETPEGAQII